MRKLLVASQKGGAGKTTTAMNLAGAAAAAGARTLLLDADPLGNVGTALNLAGHANRLALRDSGVDLAGALVQNVAPGLDVLSPYEEGGCSDDALDDLLRVLAAPAVQDGYGCLVVNTPPFLGANGAQLLAAADEYVLVMRAEPLAYRTLPAFLELVQRSLKPTHTLQMRGIILTLPESEPAGGRWERELRGRFGNRIFTQVVPHDEEVAKAALFGQVLCQASPEAPAAVQYRGLAEALGLTECHKPGQVFTDSPLLAASATVPLVGASAGRRPFATATVSFHEMDTSPEFQADLPDILPPAPDLPPAAAAPPEPAHRTPSRRVAAVKAPEAPPVAPSAAPSKAAPKAAPPRRAGNAWVGWIAAGAVLGIGVRFLHLPPEMMPFIVGLGVAAGVIVLVRFLNAGPEDSPAGPSAPPKSGPARKPGSRPELRRDANARLSNVARRTPRRNGR
ncbi:MAG TPA: ParA family protein [Gemmataceae bacterium]|nr:ParA family protein [Gemmataceae bacterium]